MEGINNLWNDNSKKNDNLVNADIGIPELESNIPRLQIDQ